MELICPACSAPDLSFDGDLTFECSYCGTTLVAGSTDCPACGERNSKAAELCANCGEPLSIVASVLDRQGTPGPPLWIRRLRTQVVSLKATEEEASAERLTAFRKIDERRMAHEAASQARQQAKDSNIIFYGLAGLLVLVLIVFLVAALG